MRAEGIAEPVSDVVVDCTGTNTVEMQVNWEVTYTSNVTSRVIGTASGYYFRDAEPIVEYPPPFGGWDYYPADAASEVVAGPRGLRWTGVQSNPLVQGSMRRFRFKNVRVNASAVALDAPGEGSVSATVRALPRTGFPLTLDNATQTVAFLSGTAGASIRVNGIPSTAGAYSYGVRVTDAAFRRRS